MNTTVTPTHCRTCGSATWTQSAPLPYHADTHRLTSVAEELQYRLWGRTTFQAFKTGATFELVPRHRHHLDGNYTTKIVLADHACHRILNLEHPDYFNTRTTPKETGDALPY